MGIFGGGKSKGFIPVDPTAGKPEAPHHLAAEKMGWDTADSQPPAVSSEPDYNAGHGETLDTTSLSGASSTHVTSGRLGQGGVRVSDLLGTGTLADVVFRSSEIRSALKGLDEDALYDAADTLGELQAEAEGASDAFDEVAASVVGAYRDSLESMADEIESWREALDASEYPRSAAVAAGNAEVSRFLAEVRSALESCDSKGFQQRMAALERQAGQEKVALDRLYGEAGA